ncbi:MFS transporter [Fluviispira multicolorata]|uniref:MFS transporter n=1 Tax=Fluviispira multicolorata TaxID=2654512 RepID=A0A833N5J6_9BACT|nr:MFS transporter [Fluviispira multicolorata]KAB8033459.1 MFS transporter [Fluviispira multicolorata]
MEQSKNKIFFLIFLVLFEFAVYLSNDMILPALTAVVQDFKAPEGLIPLSLGIFLVGSLSIQLIVGPFSDRFGRRPTMFFGGVVVLIGNILGAIAPNMFLFFIARILQGMGPCFIGVAGYACVHELYKEKEAIHVISWMASVALLAPMMGPILGSFIMLFAGWRTIFITTFILCFIGLIGLWFCMPETLNKSKARQINFKDIIINYIEIIKVKRFLYGSLSYGFLFGALMIWISSSPLILMDMMGLNATEFSLVQIPIFMSFILGTFILRYLTNLLPIEKCMFIGLIICLLGFLILICTTFLNPTSILLLIISIAIFDFGYGILAAPLNRIVLDSTHHSKGIASALFYFISFAIGSTTCALYGFIYNGKIFSFTFFISMTMLISFALLLKMRREKSE